jgi:hypothetical protein
MSHPLTTDVAVGNPPSVPDLPISPTTALAENAAAEIGEATASASASPGFEEDDVISIPLVDREEQRNEFITHFIQFQSTFHARALHRCIDDRGLKESLGLRGVYWRLFLGLLDRKDIHQWSSQLQIQRNAYELIAKKHSLRILRPGDDESSAVMGQRSRSSSIAEGITSGSPSDKLDLKVHNPLSTEQSSVWNERFASHELSQTIRHDLARTHAEIELFTRRRVQAIMFNVLFAWSKEEGTEEKGRYRQGMNELLSPIVLVLLRESRTKEGWTTSTEASTSPALENLLPTLLDSAFVEHDIYALLVRVLHYMGEFFAKTDAAAAAKALAAKKKARAIGAAPGQGYGNGNDTEVDQTPMVKKCHYIHHILLSTLDPLLYTHLNRNDVSPQLYLLRWFRLLFCREFHLEDTMLIWDVIFATSEKQNTNVTATPSSPVSISNSSPSSPTITSSSLVSASTPVELANAASPAGQGFLLAEYFSVAMLQYVRQALLQGDNSYCLRRLLRYPPVEDVRVLLARALHFSKGWQSIVSDPSMSSWTPAEHANDPGNNPNSIHPIARGQYVAEGTESFQGSLHKVSGGMGADAPLDGEQSSHQRVSGNNRMGVNPRRASAKTSAEVGGTLFSSSIASLKSFVKSTITKAGEVPHYANASVSSNNTIGATGTVASPYGVAQPKGTRYVTYAATANPTRKGVPNTSGVSHFLSPAGANSSPSPSPPLNSPTSVASSPSPSAANVSAAVLSGPTAAQHDELVLLRKELASARKESTRAVEAAHAMLTQLADAARMQQHMGQLMSHALHIIEQACGVQAFLPPLVSVQLLPAQQGSADLVALSIHPATAAITSTPASIATPTVTSVNPSLQAHVMQLGHIRDVLVGRTTITDALDLLAAPVPSPSDDQSVPSFCERDRLAIVAEMRALHARQQSASPSLTAPDASSGGGSAFPYNLPPVNKKTSSSLLDESVGGGLFEQEQKQRDAVSDLFALDDGDSALGGTFKPKATTAKPAVTASSASASVTGTAAPVVAASSPKMLDPLITHPSSDGLTKTNSTNNVAAKPTASATPAAAANGTVSKPGPVTALSAVAVVPAPVRAVSPAPSSRASADLLSGLLNSPGNGSSELVRPSTKSLFESPDSSPLFGATKLSNPIDSSTTSSSSSASNGTNVFGEPIARSTGRQRGQAIANTAFTLEQGDDSILLPSAAAFKDKTTADTALSSVNTSRSLSTAVANVKSKSVVEPTPLRATTSLFALDGDDPLLWMGTGTGKK